jgi:hypothetical protein
MRPRQVFPASWALAAALAGCAAPGAGAGHLGVGQVAGLGAGTAAGAVIGKQLGGDAGALVGGAAGLAGAAWLANRTSEGDAAAAVEAARRDERQKIMRQYWYEQTEALPGDARGAAAAQVPLHYPAGEYGGVNFGARTATDSSLAEPER